MKQDKKLAVLIDADNARADIIEPLLAEIAKYGIASVKRIYGDWSSGLLGKWREALLPHAIIPIQQFAYTKGKNATDMAMVIDAMDLLYSKTFDGFCIVSSDSDFTRLASRIRESGLTVYGFGEKKTPESFRKACDTFVYTENLLPENLSGSPSAPARSGDKSAATHDYAPVYRAVKETADDSGWSDLGSVGNYLVKVNPDFDQRNYGFNKLSDLIRTIPKLDVKEVKTHSGHHLILVRKQSYRLFIRLVQSIISDKADAKGRMRLDALCSQIKNHDPDFNSKSLGYRSVSEAVRAIQPEWVKIDCDEQSPSISYISNVKTMS